MIGVLLLLLAGTGLGHTLLVMTRSELLLSRARWDVLTRRVAAEAGRNLSSRSDDEDGLPPVGGVDTTGVGGCSTSGTICGKGGAVVARGALDPR